MGGSYLAGGLHQKSKLVLLRLLRERPLCFPLPPGPPSPPLLFISPQLPFSKVWKFTPEHAPELGLELHHGGQLPAGEERVGAELALLATTLRGGKV